MALFYDSGELGPAYATVAMATAVASVLGGAHCSLPADAQWCSGSTWMAGKPCAPIVDAP